MGNFKLKFNVARFALENSGGSVEKEGKTHNSGVVGQYNNGANFKVRDVRSYKEVVGTSCFGSGPVRQEEVQGVIEKAVVVPDRTGAFRNLFGLALVGKAKNLETLVDLDRLLRIAKVIVANVQYLGGLSMLISFHDEDSRKRFLDMKEVGDMFGKVLFVLKSFEEDRDLSIVRVGVLVGVSSRINYEVVLKWKDRSFRILVEEDLEDWIPDCLGRDPDSESGTVPRRSLLRLTGCRCPAEVSLRKVRGRVTRG
ncbi:hypothetical protein HanPI659440_Chr16g0657871 [Helianthus annuus]|nr:hypothetical protein HanPI659440_Chr16g0657871 [Helianthus annuus]